MEKMSPQRSPSTVPLARDQDGNLIALPDGAVGWRIRRQTGGRPRLLLDSKKQPMLFPLDYTITDVEDILQPGNYLLDVVDKNGEPLGLTIGVSLGTPRNAEAVESDHESSAPMVVPTTLPNTTNDVRLVLEANVRATQMAFLHNQRTLELGLRMAETLRDTVQVLATSQADWIKSLSSARGFYRNAGQAPPLEVKQLTVHTGSENAADDGMDDDNNDAASGAQAAPAHWTEPFVPLVSTVVQQVGPAIMAWAAKQRGGENGSRSDGSGNGGGPERSSDDRPPPWEFRDLIDWRYAHQKHAAYRERKAAEQQATAEQVPADQTAHDAAAAEYAARVRDAAATEHAARVREAIAAAASPGPGINPIRLLQLLPERTGSKLMQIQLALSPEEQADAMQIVHGYSAEGLEELLHVLDAASLEQSTEFLRRLVAEWRAMQAARWTVVGPPTIVGASGAIGGGGGAIGGGGGAIDGGGGAIGGGGGAIGGGGGTIGGDGGTIGGSGSANGGGRGASGGGSGASGNGSAGP